MDPQHDLTAALLAALRTEAGSATLTYARPPSPLPGGRSAALYTFELRDAPPELSGRLVVRLPAGDDRAARRERVIHAAVADAGYPVPAIRMHGDSHAGLGRPFVVMEHVTGRRPRDAAGVAGIPKLFRAVPRLLAGLMADLHAIPTGALGPMERSIDALLADVTDHDVRTWLTEHRPPAARTVICHGDLHGDNVLVAPGEVAAVLDWEMAGIGPPELDVARTALVLELLPGAPRIVRRLLARAARTSARTFVEAYARALPLDQATYDWCDALHAARLLEIGRRDDEVAALWRPVTKQLTRRLHAHRHATA